MGGATANETHTLVSAFLMTCFVLFLFTCFVRFVFVNVNYVNLVYYINQINDDVYMYDNLSDSQSSLYILH